MAHTLSPAVRSILALLIGLCSTSASAKHLAAQSPTTPNWINNDSLVVALTVEGGGTLGSYEGGLTWALVEVFRQRRDFALQQALHPAARALLDSLPTVDLRATAGASAGSINAYIAANEWCSRGAGETMDSSSFWKIWIPTGMRQLLPEKKGRGGDPTEKGILSRAAFADLFGLMDRKWSQATYDPDCTVLFGATVTRIQNDSVPVSEVEEIFARNQRFAAAFAIKPVGESSGFPPAHIPAARLQNAQFSLGALVELPVLSNNAIDREAARNLIRASSGFPLAFEPQQLRYCPDTSKSSNPPRCDPSQARESYFVDGGVFDNGPLTLAYGLALAHPKRTSLGRLTMLFVTPGQVRARTLNLPSTEDADDLSEPSPEAKSGGLDAVTKLVAAFVPSARQYELQIAHRLLPTLQEADSQHNYLKYQRDSARRAAGSHGENVLRVQDAREREWTRAITRIDSLRRVSDSLRYQLALCAVNQQCTAADSTLALGPQPVFVPTPPSKPEVATSYPLPEELPESLGQSFEKGLYATRRWHHLSGDWLLGFGGLLGRPLREYDFYVGVYDAMSLIADRMLCGTDDPPDCRQRRMRFLITEPILPLNSTDSTILAALYNEEYATRTEVKIVDSLPRRQAMVLPVVWAMGDWKKKREAVVRKCKGGPIESYECAEGLDFVFRRLRKTPGYLDRLEWAPVDCWKKRMPVSECVTDSSFAEVVADPYGELNKLAGKMLARIAKATPKNSGMMMPLSLGTAMYFATNERARRGRDMGSTSLPTGRPWPSQLSFALMPSSIGGFAGVEGWYFEWAARHHLGRNFAVGATTRAVLTSGVTQPGGANENHAVPGVRLEWKIPGPVGPWISTVGFDATTWTDGVTWPTHINHTTASWGGTALFLAQRIRVSLQRLPSRYRIRGRESPWGFVSVGFGDTNGFLYWLGRRLPTASLSIIGGAIKGVPGLSDSRWGQLVAARATFGQSRIRYFVEGARIKIPRATSCCQANGLTHSDDAGFGLVGGK